MRSGWQHPTPRLILASASASRAAVLRAAGIDFEALPAAVDEDALKQAAKAEGAPVEDVAVLLAEMKAMRIARRHPDALVIGADQMLVCEGEWFDKPADLAGARAQLLRLRGRLHELVSGLVAVRGGVRVWTHVERARLTMRSFSDAFLDAYLVAEADHVTSSVGAYRVEGPGIHLFSRIEGSHSAILGLPLLPLLDFLRGHGVLAG